MRKMLQILFPFLLAVALVVLPATLLTTEAASCSSDDGYCLCDEGSCGDVTCNRDYDGNCGVAVGESNCECYTSGLPE